MGSPGPMVFCRSGAADGVGSRLRPQARGMREEVVLELRQAPPEVPRRSPVVGEDFLGFFLFFVDG